MTEQDGAQRGPRQAPLYGEYATPEEVAAITGRPIPRATPPVSSPAAETAGEPTPHRTPWPGEERSGSQEADAPSARTARPIWDTALALGLLAAGAWNALQTVLDPASFGRAVQQSIESNGYTGDVTGGSTPVVGVVLAATTALLVVVSALLAWVAARRGLRRIFWIPLCGAVLSLVAMITGIVVVTVTHPDVAAVLMQR